MKLQMEIENGCMDSQPQPQMMPTCDAQGDTHRWPVQPEGEVAQCLKSHLCKHQPEDWQHCLHFQKTIIKKEEAVMTVSV